MFWREEQGQDLTEFSLLLAFVCLVSGAIFSTNTASMTNIWQNANTTLSQAASASS